MNEFVRKAMELADNYATSCFEGVAASSAEARSALLAHLEGGEQKWISVAERLPEVGVEGNGVDSVLTFSQPGQHADYASAYGVANTVWSRKNAGKFFSHWMPLPATPTEEASNVQDQ